MLGKYDITTNCIKQKFQNGPQGLVAFWNTFRLFNKTSILQVKWWKASKGEHMMLTSVVANCERDCVKDKKREPRGYFDNSKILNGNLEKAIKLWRA